jgi:hypothetical protein
MAAPCPRGDSSDGEQAEGEKHDCRELGEESSSGRETRGEARAPAGTADPAIEQEVRGHESGRPRHVGRRDSPVPERLGKKGEEKRGTEGGLPSVQLPGPEPDGDECEEEERDDSPSRRGERPEVILRAVENHVAEMDHPIPFGEPAAEEVGTDRDGDSGEGRMQVLDLIAAVIEPFHPGGDVGRLVDRLVEHVEGRRDSPHRDGTDQNEQQDLPQRGLPASRRHSPHPVNYVEPVQVPQSSAMKQDGRLIGRVRFFCAGR